MTKLQKAAFDILVTSFNILHSYFDDPKLFLNFMYELIHYFIITI